MHLLVTIISWNRSHWITVNCTVDAVIKKWQKMIYRLKSKKGRNSKDYYKDFEEYFKLD